MDISIRKDKQEMKEIKLILMILKNLKVTLNFNLIYDILLRR